MTLLGLKPRMARSLDMDRVKTPQRDGEHLVEPPENNVGGLLEQNLAGRLATADYDLGGITLEALRRSARQSLVEQALEYTRDYRDLDLPTERLSRPNPRILLAGHQPELFHPGVWIKNFTLSRLAAEHDALAVNLVIDGDLARNTSIRVPAGTLDAPRLETVEYAARQPEIAYVAAPNRDDSLLRSFADRVGRTIATFVADPVVLDFWPQVVQRFEATGNVGRAISQARHAWEARYGAQTLELPQSELCRTRAFVWFAVHLLAHLNRFHAVYNETISEYREQYKVRSAAHPAPQLEAAEGWLEAPFWMWTAEDQRRRALFARVSEDSIQLSDRRQFEYTLPLASLADLTATVNRFEAMLAGSVVVQTRALTTTLYARLVLGDLFLHGIGGAKYDRATDRLIDRFFGFTPPHYMAVSATKRLPIECSSPSAAIASQHKESLRELKYHPEKFIDPEALSAESSDQSKVIDLIAEKNRWIGEFPTPESAKQRYQSIRAVNTALQPWVADRRLALEREVETFHRARRRSEMLQSREFAWVLYPEKSWAGFFR